MNCRVKKRRGKKGFTLVELLIVVAIIAVLVAIAIPVYSTQLEEAREAVDEANLSTIKSLAETDWLLHIADSEEPQRTQYYTANINDDGNITVENAGTEKEPVGDIWQSKDAKDNSWENYYLTVTDGVVKFDATG